MAKLVSVMRSDSYVFERRQLPLVADDKLTMVIQFTDTCVGCSQNNGGDRKEKERFIQRFRALSSDEVAVALMATQQEILALLPQMVPCVGCRRSAERLFGQLVESGYPALEPLIISRSSFLSIKRDFLFDPQAVFALFYIHGSNINTVMEAIPKSKKNKRCMLHSLESHKTKTLGGQSHREGQVSQNVLGDWVDIWDLLSQECREEVVQIDCDKLLGTVENYLRKHRFCSECKSKVMRAYEILVKDRDCEEKGYVKSLYEELRFCPSEKHLHIMCETDYIAKLINRAEPELSGSRRERHAKTLDIAQEEVLTCIGIHIYDRLHKIWQQLKAEEQTWQILFYLGIDALRKNFEVALEKKQGISNLELICQEFYEEEQAKEQKRKQKQQKKKKKKNGKKVAEVNDNELEKNKENCKFAEPSCIELAPSCHSCEEQQSKLSSVANNTRSKSHERNRCNPHDTSIKSHETSRESTCPGHGTVAETTGGGTCPGSQGACPGGQGLLSCNRSDYGYSSGHEESVPSSRDGSDIACSEGVCNHDGDSPLCHRSELPDYLHTYENSCEANKRSLAAKCDNQKKLNYGLDHAQMGPSLLDLIEGSCSSGEEDFISEEEIRQFKATQQNVVTQRQQLRETLKQRFANMQLRKCTCKLRGVDGNHNDTCLDAAHSECHSNMALN